MSSVLVPNNSPKEGQNPETGMWVPGIQVLFMKRIFSSYLLNCRISPMILDTYHGWTPKQLSPPPTNVGLESVLFTFPKKKPLIFRFQPLVFFRGLTRNSWLDSQLKTTSLEIPFDRVSLLNKNLEHRHQQNVALMRLGVHLKKIHPYKMLIKHNGDQ